jgi:hypothetical protein
MTGIHHHASHWGFEHFLPRQALNHNPPNLYLPSSKDYRFKPPCPALTLWFNEKEITSLIARLNIIMAAMTITVH